MENSCFKKQISDDIALIQQQFSNVDEKIANDEYAFNYWILNHLYNLDEEVIPNNITDINDKGVDCFVHYEDNKELFLIQNKYYSDETPVSRECVSDFLYTPIRLLLKNQYKKSLELQKIFNRAITDSDYKIYLYFYVTNEYKSEDINTLINEFKFDKNDNTKIEAGIYAKYLTLSDIKMTYFGERFTEKKNFSAKLTTRRSGTSLDVRPEEYELSWMIDLRYVLVNVSDLYDMYKSAIDTNYELFEENIREYLGTKGINNGIIRTLKDDDDRANFFYYNNGVTIICEECKTLKGSEVGENLKNIYGFELKNPQIVNGCQTVNSIAEVLSHYSPEKIQTEFEKTFVLVKIFVFDEKTKKNHANLDVNIVRYTNSQNAINDKAFASKKHYFLNFQDEFKKRGLLLLVKPSDKNKFQTEFKDLTKKSVINDKNKDLFKFFDVEYKNFNSTQIPLEKLLKVLLAFIRSDVNTYKKGCEVLKPNSQIYESFSLNIDNYFTIDNMIKIFFTYLKADQEKKKNDKRHPIPYYLLTFMGYSFKNKTFDEINSKLDKLFSNKSLFSQVFEFYSTLTKIYSRRYITNKKSEYGVMIKQDIDDSIYYACLDDMMLMPTNDTNEDLKSFIKD